MVTFRSDLKETPMGDGIDRRTFVKRAGAAAVIAAVPLRMLAEATDASAAPAKAFRAFEFVHDRAVQIVMTRAKNPARYDLVVRKNGRKVASYPGVDTQTMDRWKTPYFSVRYVPVPSAA
jgi:hypothetical protein